VRSRSGISSVASASATNRGRIRLYANSGQQVPAGWAIDDEGDHTTDPAAAPCCRWAAARDTGSR
jgi:LDH2 family malate/lactate/ureidoglycolate dehydrogenase